MFNREMEKQVASQQLFALARMLPNKFGGGTAEILGAHATKMVTIWNPVFPAVSKSALASP